MNDVFFVVFGGIFILGLVMGSMKAGYYKGKRETLETFAEDIKRYDADTKRFTDLLEELRREKERAGTCQKESSWI